MIEALKIENYKSLKNVEAELGNFTVLVGENNSGKSAFFESIMYFKNAIRRQYAGDVINPEFLAHSFEPDTVFFRDNQGQAEQVSVIPKINLSGSKELEQLSKTFGSQGFSEEYPPESIWSGMSMHSDHWEPRIMIPTTSSNVELFNEIDYQKRNEFNVKLSLEPGDFRFTSNGVLDGRIGTAKFENLCDNIFSPTERTLEKVYYITDNRDIDSWADDPQEHEFVGHNGENTVSWLHALRDEQEIFDRIVDAITNISPDIADVKADMHGPNTRTELADADNKELFNIVSSGAGLRRLLPIIVQIAAADEEDTIMIEEPEIGVYPKTQERLVKFMLDAIEEKNIQILLSTHGIPLTWKIQNMADTEVGHCLAFDKNGGESSVEQYSLDRIPVEDYYGEN